MGSVRAPRKLVALAIPFLLLPSTSLIFSIASQSLGREAGYIAGFAFYWLVWCILAPGLILGKQGFSSLLTDRRALFDRRNWLAAALWIVVTVVAVLMYGQGFVRASPLLILLAVPLATINGLCEELLWRGLYVRLFPDNAWLGIVYPAAGFALWHFAPQIVYPAEGVVGFVLSTLFLGLAYGFIAYRTGSAKWTAVSHSLNGIVALAYPMAQAVISLLSH